jgi:hypothetical protein
VVVEILFKATLITSAALGRERMSLCASPFPVRMTHQLQILRKSDSEFFTRHVAVTSASSPS